MKTLSYLLLLLSVLPRFTHAQNTDSLENVSLRYSIAEKAIRNHFAQYATGQEISGLNNYVNYDTKDNKVTLNGIIPLKNQDKLLSLKVNGAITDGITTLFSKAKLNTNASVEARLHFLNKRKWDVTLDDERLYEKQKKEVRALYRFKEDSLTYHHYQSIPQKLKETQHALLEYQKLRENAEKENKPLIQLLQLQDNIKWYLRAISNEDAEPDDLRKYRVTLDSLQKELPKTVALCQPSAIHVISGPDSLSWYSVTLRPLLGYDSLIIVATRKLNALSGESLEKQIKELDKNRKNALQNLGNAFKLRKINLKWITLSAGVSDRTFRHIDTSATLSYNTPFNSVSFVSPVLSLALHKIRVSTFSNKISFYQAYNFSILTSDNFSSMEKWEITENQKVMNKDSTRERLMDKNFNAYAGAYKKNILTAKVGYDWYGLLNEKQSFGVHLFPELLIQKSKQELNIGVGFFMNFLKNDSKEASVTLELFTKFLQPLRGDILNNMTAGIQIGIPINLKQL